MGGVMVDAGPFIALERAGYSPRNTLEILRAAACTTELSVSAIAYTELLHGVYRAESNARAERRERYLTRMFSVIPVQPYTRAIAEIAAKLRGEEMKKGNTLPFADSLIAASALSRWHSLLTQNTTDFERVPGLQIIPFAPVTTRSLRQE